MSIRDIEVFIGFANFFQHFIQNLSKIAILLIFLLKTTKLSNLALKAFRANNNNVISSDNGKANKTVVNLSNKL